MSWTVQYSPTCHIDVLHMRRRTAERLCEAVEDFARGEMGASVSIERIHGSFICIRAPGGVALVDVDESQRTLHVSRLHPNEPLRRIIPLL